MHVAHDKFARSPGIAIGHSNDGRLLQARHGAQFRVIDEGVHDRQLGCARIAKRFGTCPARGWKAGPRYGDAASVPSALLAVYVRMRHIACRRAHREENMEQEALVPILKPCPFCGDRPQVVQTGTFAVQCADCGAMGPPAPNMERAAARWNKRKGDDFGW
jgi:Lar family restriction alleviation protein